MQYPVQERNILIRGCAPDSFGVNPRHQGRTSLFYKMAFEDLTEWLVRLNRPKSGWRLTWTTTPGHFEVSGVDSVSFHECERLVSAFVRSGADIFSAVVTDADGTEHDLDTAVQGAIRARALAEAGHLARLMKVGLSLAAVD